MWLLAFQFIQVLEKELDAVEKDKETFIGDFSEVWVYLFIQQLPSLLVFLYSTHD